MLMLFVHNCLWFIIVTLTLYIVGFVEGWKKAMALSFLIIIFLIMYIIFLIIFIINNVQIQYSLGALLGLVLNPITTKAGKNMYIIYFKNNTNKPNLEGY